MELALKKYGSHRLTWSQLIEPARRLAADGFAVTNTLARGLRGNREYLSKYAETKRIYLNNGKFYNEGDLFIQPDLAATFARLQQRGPNEFYEGQTARLIVDDMKRHNGLITTQDMRGYVAKEREALRGNYRGYEIVSMPPPSSGGAVLLEMLNILEGYDFKKMDWASSDRYHLMTEAMRRAFADRAEYMGDSDFVKVPIAGLVDKKYAAQLRNTINPDRASSSEQVRAGKPVGYESDETTHFTVGSPGGPTIINTVLDVITNVIDYGMNIQQAIDAPRIHHQWLPDELVSEPYGLSGDTQKALLARGHKLAKPRYLGDCEGIMIEEKTGIRLGATDPRRSDGLAVGY